MFKINEKATFLHTVSISVPVDETVKDEVTTKFEEQTLKVRYRVIDLKTLSTLEADMFSTEGSRAYCEALVESIADVTDMDGTPITDQVKLKDHLFNLAFVRAAIIRSYEAAMLGAKSKN